MNVSDLVIPALIVIYGIFEYQKREQKHREVLILPRENMEPSFDEPKPYVLRLWTTGIVAGLLLAIILGSLFLRPILMYGGWVIVGLAGLLLPTVMILVLILIRDIKAYRQSPTSE